MTRQRIAKLAMLLAFWPAFAMGQTSWERISTAPEGALSYDDIQFLDEARGYAIGRDAGGSGACRVMRTGDGGRSWETLSTVEGAMSGRVHFLDEVQGFVAVDGRLLRTDDGGRSWAVALDDGSVIGARCGLVFVSRSVGFFVGTKVYRTEDGGGSFHAVADIGGEAITFATPSVGYYIAQRVGGDPRLMIFRSTDGGGSWRKVFERPSDELAFDIDFSTERRGIYTSTAGVFRTLDGGETWQRVDEIATHGDRAEIAFAGPSVGYIHALSGLWRTDDGGEHWGGYFPGRDLGAYVTGFQPMGDDLLYVADIHPPGGGPPAGLWKIRRGGASDVATDAVTVTPNPFKGETLIRYNLDAPATVSLEIFDPLGKLVASPLSRAEQGAGEQSVTLNSAGMSSGVFVYRLTIGDRIRAGTIVKQ